MLDRELELAEGVARHAGSILLEVLSTDFVVESKGVDGPVTEADRRANEYIVKHLRDAFPNDGIVAEETADRSDALRKGRCWYVDPLDGTKEFIKKNDDFAVMIGLAIDGEATLGVVYQPMTDKMYLGVVGVGATLEQKGERRTIEVSQIADPSALRMVSSRSHRSKSNDAIVQALGIQKDFASGSVGLKMGLIAEQSADLYVLMSDKSSLWDACGPEAILHAAGGRVTDLDGRRIQYGGKNMQNQHGILACNSAAFDVVLPVVREVARASGLV